MASRSSSPSVLERAERHCEAVLSGQRCAGKLEVQAVERFHRDLQGCGKFSYDGARADRMVRFVEKLPHVIGPAAADGKLLALDDWQCLLLANLFGFVDGEGMRRFRVAYLQVCRGAGKSTLTAAIGLYMLCADSEEAAQVFIAATTAKQSKIVFDAVKHMIRKVPGLRNRFDLRVSGGESRTGQVRVGDTLSTLVHLCRENAGSWDGFRPSLAIVDELHAHPKEDSWAALQNGMQTRRQPLIMGITTAGLSMDENPAYERYQDARRILSGDVQDDRYFPLVFSPEPDYVKGDGWLDPQTWEKACPSFGSAVHREHYETLAAEAQRRRKAKLHFLVKCLDYWTGTGEPWLDPSEIEGCARHPAEYPEMTWGALAKTPCHIGIDLATTLDLTAVAYRFHTGGAGDSAQISVKHRYWVPEARVEDNEHYRQWAEDDWLTICPGTEIDLPGVYAQVKEDMETLDVRGVGYDPHQGRLFAQNLQRDFPALAEAKAIMQFHQSGQWPNFALGRLEASIRGGRFAFDANPVTAWMLTNANIEVVGASEYMRLVKPAPDLKVDGVAALMCATNIEAHLALQAEAEGDGFGIAAIDWDAV